MCSFKLFIRIFKEVVFKSRCNVRDLESIASLCFGKVGTRIFKLFTKFLSFGWVILARGMVIKYVRGSVWRGATKKLWKGKLSFCHLPPRTTLTRVQISIPSILPRIFTGNIPSYFFICLQGILPLIFVDVFNIKYIYMRGTPPPPEYKVYINQLWF